MLRFESALEDESIHNHVTQGRNNETEQSTCSNENLEGHDRGLQILEGLKNNVGERLVVWRT